jgi:hypothetical protein
LGLVTDPTESVVCGAAADVRDKKIKSAGCTALIKATAFAVVLMKQQKWLHPLATSCPWMADD